mmetsp:Transcript_29449/g.71658  ORF Transcript_29449/g.71658 Transcript_29449/m.71658 type:complete len:301 (-) Transcript_29449:693-1595(-)
MGNLALTIVGAGASLLSIGLGALYALQEHLLYFPNMPTRDYEETPRDYLMAYDDASILTQDGVLLHAWLIKQPDPTAAPTLLYFHGNAGNIAHRLKDARSMYSMVRCNILMLSYRGYGESQGRPGEKGFVVDAQAALQYVQMHPEVGNTPVFAFGRSIGGAVALALADRQDSNRQPIRGLILENTFTSINAMIDVVMPPYLGFLKWMNRNRWESRRRIESMQTPILFISGLQDELVPPAHMQELFKAATQSRYKKIELIANGTHNDTWFRGGNAYYFAIADFVDHVRRKLAPSADASCDA